MPGPGSYWIAEEEKREVLEVLEAGHLSRYGDFNDPRFLHKVISFEHEFAEYIGVRHAVATSSGTSGLLISYIVNGLQPGDEVIIPTYGYVATYSAAIFAGLVPVPAEIDDSLTLDPRDVERRITTVPGFLADRFGPACGTIYSCIVLFVYVFMYLVTVLYSGSLAFAELTGWNLYTVLFLTAFFVGAYSIRGGMASVMWADLVQCLLLMVGGATLFFLALGKIDGGWQAMVSASPERTHLYKPADHEMAPFLGMILATFGMFTFYQVGNQAMIQRMLGARSTWDALMGLVLASFINFFRPLVTCFLGLVVYHWIHVMHQAPPLDNHDTTFTFALAHLAPGWGVRGVVLAGLIAAVRSATSALVNSTSTLFANDIYKKLIDRSASEHRMVVAGQVSAVIALAIAASIAPMVGQLGGIFRFFQTAMTYIACPFMATVLIGILWKRMNYAAGLFGLIGGLVIQVILAVLFTGYVPGIPRLHFFYVGAIAQVVIVLGIVAVTLATPPPDPRRVSPYLWRLGLLEQYDEGARRPWYQQLKFWWVIVAVVWFYLYWRFW